MRSLDILWTLAEAAEPLSLRQLTQDLKLPRASLHRLLRTLEAGGYLRQIGSGYSLGSQSFRLARLIGAKGPATEFPRCARPVLERLARETGETIILGVLSDRRKEIVYADVIVADSPLQYAVPTGDRRPLYSSATGKCVLAFMPAEEQARYIDGTEFVAVTPFTTKKHEIVPILAAIRETGVIHDRDGHFIGAGAIASPVVDATGAVFASVVVAGPNERLDQSIVPIPDLVRKAGQAISQILGYEGAYPPPILPARIES